METHQVQWLALRQLCQRLMMQEDMSEEDALLCPLRTERFQKGGNA